MINVDQITARLAKLPDAALQQYAAMHKNDPYIMALAVSESNRRKALRQGAQSAQGMVEPPKVADQALAEMAPAPRLPEDRGIARLPAGDMNFAGGGIVAFADGGDVERYQFGGNTFSPEFGLAAPDAFDMDELRRQEVLRKRREAEEAARLEFLRRSAPEVAARLQATQSVVPPVATPPAVIPPAATGTVPPATTGKPPAPGPRKTPGASPTPPTAPAAPIAAVPDVAALTESALKKASEQANPFVSQLEDLSKARVAAKEEEVKGLEAIQKQFADIFKGRKERLDTREAEIGKLKDQGLGLALLQAGAAIMSTPGSVGTAVGKGVQVGTERYAAGLEKLQAAKEKLNDARDRLEELEAQRGELSARELFKARSDVKNTMLSGKEDLIKSNMQMYGVNRETAMKMVDAQIRVGISQFEQGEQTKRTGMEVAGRERTARIAAGAPSAQERIALALGGGNLEKGLTRMAEIQAGKFDVRKAYSDYLVAAQKGVGDVMSFVDFASQFAMPSTSKPPSGATVLRQP